jgi:hypothetical protein
MENINNRRVIRISRKKLIISVVVVLLIIGFLIYFGLMRSNGPVMTSQENGGTLQIPSSAYDTSEKSANIYNRDYPYQYQGNPTIEDTREFLKTSYNAEIQTRNVKNTVRDVRNTVRDVGGRIDSSNENPKDGYVSFVVPKSNFDNFKDEIASITNEKLIIENVSSENLLSQKQSIEQQQQTATDFLVQLEQQQKDLIAKHNQTKSSLQSKLTDLEYELNQFSRYLPPVLNPAQIAQIESLNTNINLVKQQIASENSSFNTNNQNLKNQIAGVNAQLSGIAQQDTNFTNNIETVSGSISVKWISLWQLARIFSPISPVIIIIVLVIILWFIFRKKSYIPKIEFV